jgi:two-component sensor kinase czcS
LCAQKGLSFSSQIAEGVRVNGDELLLIRLINNLLSNALKFTRSSVALELCVSADACELSISDDGEGIKPALQNKIWDKLYQIERSRNREQNSGAGLGLAITSQIAKIHGAQISLRSKVGRGSKFSVKLKKV